MTRSPVCIGLMVAGLAAAAIGPQDGHAAPTEQSAPRGPLNTLEDIRLALSQCWQWPPLDQIANGMDITVLLSFKRNGEIFGAKITYESKLVSERERALYHQALLDAVTRCSPLPVTDNLGNAIAGRPFRFYFHDTRRERKA